MLLNKLLFLVAFTASTFSYAQSSRVNDAIDFLNSMSIEQDSNSKAIRYKFSVRGTKLIVARIDDSGKTNFRSIDCSKAYLPIKLKQLVGYYIDISCRSDCLAYEKSQYSNEDPEDNSELLLFEASRDDAIRIKRAISTVFSELGATRAPY